VTTAAIPRLRRVPRQARSRERLQRVLDAADDLLATEGAAALTTTRVAQAAGVSVGSLYQYLPDKDAIVEALARRYLAEFEQLMERLVERAEHESWDDPVGLLVDTFADHYRARPGYRALWFGRNLNEELRALDRDNKLTIAAGVRQVLDVPELEARAGVLVADALLQDSFRDGDAVLIDEAKRILRLYLEDVARG
jgi:AcrR family transcriptional regulator